MNEEFADREDKEEFSYKSFLFTKQWLCFLVFAVLIYSQLLSVVYAQEDGAQTEVQQTEQALIDINSADAQALASALSGVGLVKAQEIVRYREMYGDFIAVEELSEVKGIGPALLERNRHRLKPIGKLTKNE